MDNKYYYDITISVIVILVLIIVLSSIINYFYFKTKPIVYQEKIIQSEKPKKVVIVENPESLMPPTPADDVLTEYDQQVAFHPMVAPSRRPPRHVILPNIGNPYFNYPTRGFTDSYALQGYLVREHNDNHHRKLNTQINNPTDKDFNAKTRNDDQLDEHYHEARENQILKLFGREKFPNSTEYEYYVMINTGYNDNIKYFLENVRKELYDGDNVYIDILKAKYRVKLMKERIFEYNPYFI